MPRLLTIEEAAKQLGVPCASLRTAADGHGYLVRMGRAVRIDPSDLEEIIKKCQDRERQRACTTAPTGASGSSVTATDACQRAQATAAKLKVRSRGTSQNGTGPPAQVLPIR